ncbi:NAD-dependent epimerase/dehydratase family protein [Pseudanabaena sp. lw0831]|uniref:NAD-dependent epimerase/dehydratase family protein n=1 Tax=Pseudanabaena sp. lw0831 TaxID=1357935 RepID=UPI0019154728|nr:NAD-dependent epimerase/dehydratase family protein [Pseudanabaena sp. lw0831]
MKIGITGALGFLGSYLLKYLMNLEKYELFALSRNISPEKIKSCGKVVWIEGDLSSNQICADFVKNLDLIIHLAHTNTPLTSNKDISSDTLLNLVPTLNLLQAVRDYGSFPHLIYASSGGAIYKHSPNCQSFKESDPCEPSSSYGIQKLTVENYLRLGAEQSWLTATSLRIGNPYGVLLPSERMQGLIGVALNQVLHRQPVKIYGDPNNVRDYIHLEDMCRMFELVIHKQSSFEVYNVGSGKGYSVNQILDLIEKLTGVPITKELWQTSQTTNQLPSWIVLDIKKSYENLSWEPLIKLEQGLAALCEQILWNQ